MSFFYKLLLLLYCMWLLTPSAMAAATTSPPAVTVLPTGGPAVPGCPATVAGVESLDEVLALDDSGSEFGPRGSDPGRSRYVAADFAARYLAAASQGRCHRLAIVRFGGTAPATRSLALTPVHALGKRLRRALAPRPPLGPTRYAPALDRARRLLGTPVPGRRAAVVLVTDGRPNDPDVSAGRQLDAERQAVKALGQVSVHLVVINRNNSFTAADQRRWRRLGVASIDRLDATDHGAFERLFARLLRRDLRLHGEAEHPVLAGRDVIADVSPLNDALVVSSTATDAATVVELRDPEGRVVKTLAGPAAVTRVARPVSGRWRLRLAKGGPASAAIAAQPLTVRTGATAGQTWPQGRPLTPRLSSPTLAAALRRGEDLAVSAVIRDPLGRTRAVSLAPSPAGTFIAARGTDTTTRGTYGVGFTIRAETRLVETIAPSPVAVQPTPYFVIDTDDVDSRDPLRIPAELYLRGKPVDARRAVQDDPDAVASAHATSDGRALRDVRVVFDHGSHFTIISPDHAEDWRPVQVALRLGASDRAGQEVRDLSFATAVARPSHTQVSGDRWRRLWTGVVIFAIALLLAYAAWLARRPRMEGSVRVAKVLVTLDRSRLRRVPPGADAKRTIWIFELRGSGLVQREGRIPLPWGTRPITRERRPTLSRPIRSSVS
jgi:hypothetical protein